MVKNIRVNDIKTAKDEKPYKVLSVLECYPDGSFATGIYFDGYFFTTILVGVEGSETHSAFFVPNDTTKKIIIKSQPRDKNGRFIKIK